MDSSTVWKIITSYFHDNPQCLVDHHIDSFDDFYKAGIQRIFKEKNPIRVSSKYNEKTGEFASECLMYFGGKEGDKIYFGKPIIYDEDNSHYMFPNEARLRNMTYGMTIHYDVDIEFIDILEPGQLPTVIGGQYMKQLESHDYEFDDKTSAMIERDVDLPFAERQAQDGGAPKPVPKRRQKKEQPLQMTPAVAAMLREATEKSMIKKNTQKREHTLEKVYLGKFPIMLQSKFCVLSGLPREARFNMGECRNDVGGYFIIDGKEKTVICQEKFADNMLYIRKIEDDKHLASAEIRSVSENASKPIRTLSLKIVAPSPSYTYENIVVNIPNVRKPVPLFIVFRALGVISDKAIITRCLLDLERYENMVDLFIPSVHDAGPILTQQTALKYIGSLTKGKGVNHALEILSDYFLPHVGETNYIQKSYYLGYMVFRLLCAYKGMEPYTDRDNYKFKRVEQVGDLLYELFRDYYTIQQREIQLDFEKRLYYNKSMYEDNLFALIYENHNDVFRHRSLEAGFKKAFKGNWGAKPHTKRVGVVQDVNRLSFNSALNHLRKITLPMDPTAKIIPPRMLHSSQWGIIDPIDTPDGGNIGLHKHLSISTRISRAVSREPLIAWLREKVAMKLVEECSDPVLVNMTKIIVNGLWAGVVSDPVETVAKIRFYRRNALLSIYMSVTFDMKFNTIFIYCDGGRLCRPIFYKDEISQKISYYDVLSTLDDEPISWADLTTGSNKKKEGFDPNAGKIYELHELYEGVGQETNPVKLDRFLKQKAIIDFLDTSESENALIALNTGEFEKTLTEKDNIKKSKQYTHCEIHESLILGMMCNLIIFPENNPLERNSFSCGQSKQACSLYHTNYQVRMDKTAVVLNNGQIPLVKSRYLELINHEENPYGENAIVAIMCYTGYNVEDAILVNEGALKRGLFRTTYFSTYEAHEEINRSDDVVVQKKFSNVEGNEFVVGTKPGYDYTKLDAYGLIREDTPVNDKTVLIGQTLSNSNSTREADMSKVPKKGQVGRVDKSFITEGEEGHRIAKIRIREERIPNLGDKMASRSGQKGTIGLIIPEEDMPFTRDGLRPDLIINPHALPSRRTLGQLVECITGKACAMYGGFGECTAFMNRGSKIGIFGELLSKVGYHSSGNEILYNGMTGEQLESEIFIGPTYYMRLKHMVKDKVNYRALGPRSALTKQPVGGRANDGGLRIGEMERDTVISHGATNFLRESMMERGDKYYFAVCNNTGMLAIYNPAKNLFLSPMADGPVKFTGSLANNDIRIENISKFGRDFSLICAPYSLKLLIQELQTINVQVRIITEDTIQQLENMSYSKNVNRLMHMLDSEPMSKVIDMVQKETLAKTRGKKEGDIYNSVESTYTPTPSPEFATGSPAYQPEYDPNDSPAYDPNASPAYNPIASPANSSSVYNPNASSTDESSVYNPNGEFEPRSPDEPPPTDQFGSRNAEGFYEPRSPSFSPTEEERRAQAGGGQEFLHKGGKVFLRTDTKPRRLWNVKNVGNRFVTIETEDRDGISDPFDMIRVISNRNDLIDPKTAPAVPAFDYSRLSNPAIHAHGNPGQAMGPAPVIINFSPKMVAGNDNSRGSNEGQQTTMPYQNEGLNDITMSDLAGNGGKIGGGSSKTNTSKSDDKPVENKSIFDRAIDFSKLVINKIG